MVAVTLEAGEVGVARLVQIHRHPVDDLVEPRLRDPEPLDRGGERARDRVARRAGEERGDFDSPPRELCRRNARVGALVDDVVDLAAEGVQRSDGASPFGGMNRNE